SHHNAHLRAHDARRPRTCGDGDGAADSWRKVSLPNLLAVSLAVKLQLSKQKPPRARGPGGFISRFVLEPTVGFEPTTYGLQNRCSAVELRRRGPQRPMRYFSLLPAAKMH